MKITSYGAAREVTGTRHLLEIGNYRVLIDCGLCQGHREEADRKNRDLGFNPSEIHDVILTHAHIDHSGMLPVLVKKGFGGRIYSTAATRSLCSIMLMDSAHIQERDAQWLAKKQMAFIPPLYQMEDVRDVLRHFVSLNYGMRIQLHNDVSLTFHDAGHVLGSAMVELEYIEDQRLRRFIFTGDLGRKNMPILCDPWEPKEAHVVMMESTYGNREHGAIESVDEKLAAVINETHARGGKVIIPSFALERAQEVIFALKRLEESNAIPDLPVFVDSPMTVNITEVFRQHTEDMDNDFGRLMRNAANPFDLKRIRYIRNLEESMQLNHFSGSAIIIAASGMCEYGRIVHHLANTVEDPRNTILIVGYQAEHTLGRAIVDRKRQVRIHGVNRDLRAHVKVLNEFSAHAGRSDLLAFGARFNDRLEKMLLVHGEDEALYALETGLRERGLKNIHAMEYGKTVIV